MADDFDAGICSGMGAGVSCSSAINDTSGGGGGGVAFRWPSTADAEPGSSASAPLADASFSPSSVFAALWQHQQFLLSCNDQEINHHHRQQFLMQQQRRQQSGFPMTGEEYYPTDPLLNAAPFWSPSASLQQFNVTQSFQRKPNCSTITTTKSNTDSATKRSGSSSSSSTSEASLKKPKIEKPSPLPAFKVRKEKLGDRISALQQLVSPFGKTDTASVLHEAIQYIKFLHGQVDMLSTPYLKNGNPIQHQQSSDGDGTKPDLRSRGLCLVPMESISPVESEMMADFWTPTFGGTYR